MTTLVHHVERCPDNVKLHDFVNWWQGQGPFPITIVHGDRTDAEQRKLYAIGRTLPGKIVTHAQTATQSAHGHSGAIDCHPVRELYATGGVRLVYLGDETDPEVRAEAQRRFDVYVGLVREHGLESGRDFPGFHDDPHAQDPDWRSRPVTTEEQP